MRLSTPVTKAQKCIVSESYLQKKINCNVAYRRKNVVIQHHNVGFMYVSEEQSYQH